MVLSGDAYARPATHRRPAYMLLAQLSRNMLWVISVKIFNLGRVPGPYLIRVKQEFNLCTGEGGEGTVYEASSDFAQNLARLATTSAQAGWTDRIKQSASTWRACVIKQLRSDGDRPLAFQTNSARTEINILSKKQFAQHPHIVTLLGWALCLDSLEHPTSSAPRLPLLVLEKSRYDLRGFLDSNAYDGTEHQDLCALCFGIGRGLQALHEEHISHGDVKPANVLIFERDCSNIKKDSLGRWVAKLCDFGLATTFKETSQSPNPVHYRGTGGWKPPETYLKSPLKTFRHCDVFAYGLVVWCIFIGVPSSPICAKDQDEESTAIVANIGQQTYYHSASQSIRRAYDLVQGVRCALSEVVDDSINVGPGPSKFGRPFRTRRRGYLAKPTETKETEINRVLTVLRESLNDDPARRDQQPWRLMDMKVEIVGSVQGPSKYSAKPANSAHGYFFQIIGPCSKILGRLSLRNARATRRAEHIYFRSKRLVGRSVISFTLAWFPWLLPQKPKQQAYYRIYSNFESQIRSEDFKPDSRPYSFKADGIDAFEHPKGVPCHNLSYLYDLLQSALEQSGAGSPDAYVLYNFARIRSRVKFCCWRRQLRISFFTDANPSLGVEELAMEQEKSLYTKISYSKDLETLTWLCRGDVAQIVMQKMQGEPTVLWGWLGVPDSDPNRRAAKMTLLLERGCNIGQLLLCGGHIRSPFSWYLDSLSPEDSSTAITVCHQFRRVARDEAATAYVRFYLTGQSPDLRDDENLDELEFRTTALHDAVMASNYDVVEYLVRTDFLVNVEDHMGCTALQLADCLAHNLSNDKKSTKRSTNNQIIALLGQSKAIAAHRSHDRVLPIGWEEIRPKKTSLTVAAEQQIQADRTIPKTQQQHESARLLSNKDMTTASSAQCSSRIVTPSQFDAAVQTTPEVDGLTENVRYNSHDSTKPKMSPLKPRTIPIQDVLFGNHDNSCYVTIGGNVYDVMPFLSKHPGGGDRILEYRGQDVSKIMGNESSHQHSIAAYEKLEEHFFGALTVPDVSTAAARHRTIEDKISLRPESEELLWSEETGHETLDTATADLLEAKDLMRETESNTGYNMDRVLGPLPPIPTHEVASHNSHKSCYVTIGTKVYDITDFLGDHPGGADLILEYGGRDISKIMGDELSHAHSEDAYEVLEAHLIGLVADKKSMAALKASGVEDELAQNKAVFATTGMSGIENSTKETDLNMDYRIHKFLDLNKPLLIQVWNGGFSKEFYMDQVHRPRYYSGGGSAPLFGNFLEPLTKTVWWVVPMVWLPPVIYGTILAGRMLSLLQTAKYWLVGYLLWSLIEYTVHRFIFHCDSLLPDNRLAITIHFLVHGLHHFLPMDMDRIARPPALFLILASPLYLLTYLIFFWDFYVATAVASGATFGYVCFEATHYFLHIKQLSGHYGDLKKHHMQHHYADYENGFGVTTGFWDRVFRTELELEYPRKERR